MRNECGGMREERIASHSRSGGVKEDDEVGVNDDDMTGIKKESKLVN
jgi:hypothetical protein